MISLLIFTLLIGLVMIVLIGSSRGPQGAPPSDPGVREGRAQWITFTDPNGAFDVDLPTTPMINAEETTSFTRSRLFSETVGGVTFYIEYDDYLQGFTGGVYGQELLDRQPDLFAQGVGGTLLSSQRVSVGGLPAYEFSVKGRDGYVWRVATVLAGKRLYRIQVLADVDPLGAFRRVTDSFTPLTPGAPR